MTKRWIKVPGPGQFRGDGRWMELAKWHGREEDWLICRNTGFLPTHEGEEPPPQPYLCKFCGAPSWIEPSEQSAPPDYCHPSDHGEEPPDGH